MFEEAAEEPDRRRWWSFWSLTGMQVQNAFNDNVAKFLLVPLGAWLVARGLGFEGTAHVLVLLQVVPFILLAPTAGWLADRFPKHRVLRGAAWAQLLILAALCGAMTLRSLPLALFIFFLLSCQSAVFGPAKMGVVKELLGGRRLAFGSGVLEGTVILAILAGQVGGSWWFDHRLGIAGDGWEAGRSICLVLLLGALVSIALGQGIQPTRSCSQEPYRLSTAWAHVRDLGVIWSTRAMRLCAIGVSFFWAFATFINLVLIQIADEQFGGGEGMGRELATLLIFSGMGIGLGSIVAGVISRRRIELGLTPLGGLVLAAGLLALGFADPGSLGLYLLLLLAGLGASLFLVPLHATVIDRSPADRRGAVISALTLMSNLAGALGALLQYVLVAAGLGPPQQFLVMAAVVVAVSCYVLRLLPREFLRFVVLGLVRAVYRVEVFNGHRMPEKGGVLLTPNHVSFVDVFILSAASPRPVRFLMIRDYFAVPMVGSVARLFQAVPISATRAKDAIRVAAEALEEGSVVCIFPEGQLSRSGMLNEIKNGFSLIARKAGCPVLPVFMDGVWGSIFSAERGTFFWKLPRKLPYGMRVAFGEARDARETTRDELRHELCRLNGETLARRDEATGSIAGLLGRTRLGEVAAQWEEGGEWRSCTWQQLREVVEGHRTPEQLTGGQAAALAWVREWPRLAELPFPEAKKLVVNALQLAEPGDLGLGHPVLLGREAPEVVRRVWGMLLPALTRSRTILLRGDEGLEELRALFLQEDIREAVGGADLRERLRDLGSLAADLRLFRFDGEPQETAPGTPETYAGFAADGLVLSVSMPHALKARRMDQPQQLWKPGTFGRLLPGFAAYETPEGLELLTAGGRETITLSGLAADPEGFLGRR